jgi:transcriptional regulator with XRE-family HTH domain
MKLGSNLQILRKLHGNMTQEKLAERMNVSRQTVSKW